MRKLWLILKAVIKFFNRTAFLLAASFMIGFSNAMNDENIMINDNKPKIELKEMLPDEDDDD